jgi:hypothetical protein
MSDQLEQFWNEILSRVPERIQQAFTPLSLEEKQIILTHLERMVSEPGWHPEQIQSAKAALTALQSLDSTN